MFRKKKTPTREQQSRRELSSVFGAVQVARLHRPGERQRDGPLPRSRLLVRGWHPSVLERVLPLAVLEHDEAKSPALLPRSIRFLGAGFPGCWPLEGGPGKLGSWILMNQ